MKLEFKWLPTWTASSVRTKGNRYLEGIKVDSPFLRAIWDLYSLSLWGCSMLFNSKTYSKSSQRRVWPFVKENLEWSYRYIIPVVSFFCSTLTIFPQKGGSGYDSENFAWELYQSVPCTNYLYCKAADDFQYLLVHSYRTCKRILSNRVAPASEDDQMTYFAPGRLAFKMEGAGKVRVFAIPNAFKQALLRPAHDWCMSVLKTINTYGTYNQLAPLSRLSKLDELYSFDLSSATDRYPLAIQAITINALFDSVVAFAWVVCGLGCNAFSCQTSRSHRPEDFGLVRFETGQPLGLLSSWPLFSLCHHFLVWYCENKVYPGRIFKRYALLGDDIVIGDARVAEVYQDIMNQLGVKISLPKSFISKRGALEFAKKFRIHDTDLSPISVKMLRTTQHAVSWMPVCKSVGVKSLRVSLRLRGAGYRRYSSQPTSFHPHYNRHWFRHVLVCFSPSGIAPYPFEFWLGFPEGFLPSPSQMGMVREMLLESCAPDWRHAERIAADIDALDDDTGLLIERKLMVSWAYSMIKYLDWYQRARFDYSVPISSLLDPPAYVFKPQSKDPLLKFHKYGRLFKCYDLIRTRRAPLEIELTHRNLGIDIVQCVFLRRMDSWYRPSQSWRW